MVVCDMVMPGALCGGAESGGWIRSSELPVLQPAGLVHCTEDQAPVMEDRLVASRVRYKEAWAPRSYVWAAAGTESAEHRGQEGQQALMSHWQPRGGLCALVSCSGSAGGAGSKPAH